MPAKEELSLVLAAKSGNEAAFEQLFERYRPGILRTLEGITQNREDAEDAAQEALLKAYLHLDEFQGHSSFYTWLTRIAINQALMILRKRRPYISLDEPEETDGRPRVQEIPDQAPLPDQQCANTELQGTVARLIAELGPGLQQPIQLQVIEERSILDVACLLGLSVAAVKSRLLRAPKQLGRGLAKYLSVRHPEMNFART